MPSRAEKVICYIFHGWTTLLACKSKLRKVSVRIKLSIGSKVVWHLYICMAKACLLEYFAIFVHWGYVQCCWPFFVTEKLTSTKVLVINFRAVFSFLGNGLSHSTSFHFVTLSTALVLWAILDLSKYTAIRKALSMSYHQAPEFNSLVKF